MSAVDDFAAEAGAGDDAPPIENYQELTVAKVLPLLPGLNRQTAPSLPRPARAARQVRIPLTTLPSSTPTSRWSRPWYL